MTRGTSAWAAAWTCLVLLVLMPPAAMAVNCDRVNVSPVADFEYSVVPSDTAPLMVNFFSTPSVGGRSGSGPVLDRIESYHWFFGDGSVSDDENPVHSYASGSARSDGEDKPFAVTLTIKTACDRTAVVTKNVSVYCLNHTPGFAFSQPVGEGPYNAPVALMIRDTTTHARESVTSWHYTVWDAAMTRLYLESTEKDPVFIIRNGGSYVIRQEIHKACSPPSARDTDFRKNIVITGSAESDAIPMETIPFTPIGAASPAGTATAVTVQPVPTTATTRPTPAIPRPADLQPGTGILSVNTSPAGAGVFVNDAPLGTSPVTIPGLSAGQYNLRLEKEGFRNETVRIEIGDRKVTEYSAVLAPQSSGTGDTLPVVPAIAAVVVIAVCAGAAVWFFRRKKKPPEQRRPDGNALFLVEDLGK
ncbi:MULTISPECIES: PEGA domain-containing protein [unclassified Methanoregula]|uniref:PEGA domain-containing protein n=1 Tax=unclassified Methanoregula TaxID=2649730 RepID=UPI0009CA11EC|nr:MULTISPECIES: PEGA domain-containing protein [unclassified Methanoregula]OPX61569.1 MAG: PEGA domain protein [Methanoregula sp. PtaB.Bin085]OPY36767.1 MAG: PEGA domain protein [Methanoregula sp. PtaU1.Bin006]